jgi:uncharacterized Zn-binding protein involved in type VI secretion
MFAARILDQTVTGDTITGPGAPTVLIGGKPAACMGDLVAGGVVTQGAITMGSMTVLILNRPAARVGSQVTGVSVKGPVTTPITTAGAPPGCPTVLIGG